MEGLGQPQVAGPGPHQGVRAALSCPSRLCRGQRGHATGLKCWLPPGTDWSCTGSLDSARVGSALGGRLVHSQRGRSDSCFPLGPLGVSQEAGKVQDKEQEAQVLARGQLELPKFWNRGLSFLFPLLWIGGGPAAGRAAQSPTSPPLSEERAVHPALLHRPGSHNIQASLVLDPTTGPQLGACCVCFICHLLLWPGRAFAWLTGGHAGNSGRGAVEPGGVRAVAWPGSCPSCVLHIPDAAFSRKGGRAEEWWR